jgi:hypothetical protein
LIRCGKVLFWLYKGAKIEIWGLFNAICVK